MARSTEEIEAADGACLLAGESVGEEELTFMTARSQASDDRAASDPAEVAIELVVEDFDELVVEDFDEEEELMSYYCQPSDWSKNLLDKKCSRCLRLHEMRSEGPLATSTPLPEESDSMDVCYNEYSTRSELISNVPDECSDTVSTSHSTGSSGFKSSPTTAESDVSNRGSTFYSIVSADLPEGVIPELPALYVLTEVAPASLELDVPIVESLELDVPIVER